MENIIQMRIRHQKEIENLQNKCKHKKVSDWIEKEFASEYGYVKVCEICGKVVKYKSKRMTASVTTSSERTYTLL